MYLLELFNSPQISIFNLIAVQNVVNILLFILLTFVGTGVRVSIDTEFLHKKVKGVNFVNRWFIATVLAYIIEIFISERDFLKHYYSELIITFCIFVNDIVKLIIHNIFKIFTYLVSALTKGMIDLRNTTTKNNNKDNNI